MTTDPAIDAAERVHCDGGYLIAVAAAREALAPLRELHKACKPYLNDNPYDTETALVDCVECETPWPCDTAVLIYPSEEL